MTSLDTHSTWSAQQLAEFLAAVSAYEDEQRTLAGGLELISEAFEAEVGAVVHDGVVLVSVGFPEGRAPDGAIVEAATGATDRLVAPGIGACEVLVVPVELGEDQGRLLLARSGGGFSREESSLLRAMARVLSLTLRSLRVLETLRERQALLEKLAGIQRAISLRMPIQEVLDAITAGASSLLGDDFTALYFRDGGVAASLTMASSCGVPQQLSEPLVRRMYGQGASGMSVAENRLVVIEDYADSPDAASDAAHAGVQAAMAVPVHDHGEIIGSLLAASLRRGRRYSPAEQDLLGAFAEHASLAVTDAKTVDALHTAVDDALHRALHDPLTGLANRTRFFDRLGHALSVRRQRGREVAVLYVDLDDFKTVNDRFGHAVGDELLIDTARRLMASLREGDTVARIGGDEFAVLIENADGVAEAERTAERILQALREGRSRSGMDLAASASIGIAVAGAAGLSADEMLRNADVAMYRAKSAGKGGAVLFEPQMYESLLERIELEADLRRALEGGEFAVHFQPMADIATEAIVGVEALARWNHPTRGAISPSTFIPLAEATGLIVPLGRDILSKAASWVGAWQRADPGRQPLSLSVNVSAVQLQHPGFPAEVRAVLAEAGMAAGSLIFDISESVLVRESDATLERLHELHSLGVRLALDDFGTGFSSLRYLRRFPVDLLKIDRSFIAALRSGEETVHQLTEAILVLGSTLGLECVAEGVEHVDELHSLRRLGCPFGQGPLFADPMPPEAFARFLNGDPPGVQLLYS